MPTRIVDAHAHIYPQRYLEFIRDIVHNDSTFSMTTSDANMMGAILAMIKAVMIPP